MNYSTVAELLCRPADAMSTASSPCKRSADDGREEGDEVLAEPPVADRPVVAPKAPLKLPPLPPRSPIDHASLFVGNAHAAPLRTQQWPATHDSPLGRSASARAVAPFDLFVWTKEGDWAPPQRGADMGPVPDDQERAPIAMHARQRDDAGAAVAQAQAASPLSEVASSPAGLQSPSIAQQLKVAPPVQHYTVANVTAAVVDLERRGEFSQRGIRLVCDQVQRAKAIAATHGKDPDSLYYERCALCSLPN